MATALAAAGINGLAMSLGMGIFQFFDSKSAREESEKQAEANLEFEKQVEAFKEAYTLHKDKVEEERRQLQQLQEEEHADEVAVQRAYEAYNKALKWAGYTFTDNGGVKRRTTKEPEYGDFYQPSGEFQKYIDIAEVGLAAGGVYLGVKLLRG